MKFPRYAPLPALALALTLAVVGCRPTAVAPPPPPPLLLPNSAPVQLLYLEAAGCPAGIVSLPTDPRVHRNPSNGPPRVQWRVDESQKGLYFWEFEYDGASGGMKEGNGDWLGKPDGEPYTIDCTGSPEAHTKTAVGLPGEAQKWPYKITIYQCDGDQQGPEVCEQDPIIWIDP